MHTLNMTKTAATVAGVILSQIRATNRWALASWGCTGFGKCVPVAMDSGVMLGIGGGRKVVITLEADDTYTIEIGRMVKLDWKVARRVEGVFADALVEVIDSLTRRV